MTLEETGNISMLWRGKDINTLSKEELIEVIKYLASEVETARESLRSVVEIHELSRKARR